MDYGITVKIHNWIDGILKFPNLKKGEVGIQIGFDMSSKSLTSDLVVMGGKTKKNGLVLGIDPDPFNLDRVTKNKSKLSFKYKLVLKGTYSKQTNEKLIMAKKASWNKLEVIDTERTQNFTDGSIEVELDTLDNIVKELDISIEKIGHINITNNGAEFDTLLGMEKILSQSKDLSITVIAGRPGKMGQVGGMKDFEAIGELLDRYGFTHKLEMKSKLFWWGPFHQGLLKRRKYKGKSDFGVIMAGKGKKTPKWYQSFS